jgi:hypothetical protein
MPTFAPAAEQIERRSRVACSGRNLEVLEDDATSGRGQIPSGVAHAEVPLCVIATSATAASTATSAVAKTLLTVFMVIPFGAGA